MKAIIIKGGIVERCPIDRFEISNYNKGNGYVVLYNAKEYPNDIRHIDLKDLQEVCITEDDRE